MSGCLKSELCMFTRKTATCGRAGPNGDRSARDMCRGKKQIRRLIEDGYSGYLSLETHWPGPNGDKLEASRICGWNLRGLASL